MSASRTGTIVATGARLLVGAVVAVGSVVAVSAAVFVPWPGVSAQPAQTTVTSVPGDATLSCAGSFRALGRDASDADQMASAGSGRITVGGDTGDPERTTLDTPDLTGGRGAPVFTRAVEGRESPLVAASESFTLTADDLTGLAAGSCGEPSTESWIVGGSTDTGESDVLVISNPGTVTATVTLSLYGETPDSSNVVVPAQTQIAMPFAAIAADAEAPVVRVTAEGSPVRAVLQSALVSVLDPAGIDLQAAMTEPSPTLDFAGVQVAAPVEGGTASNVLRLLAPGADTQARIVIRDETGASLEDFTAPLVGGTPLDVALSDLEIGDYRIQVTADEALVGAVWQSSGTGEGTDFAWMTPAPALGDDTLVAVPNGPDPRLHLIAADGAAVTVTAQNGTPQQVDVSADGFAEVSVRAGTVYRISADAPISAAVTLSAPGRLAGWPVEPGAAAPRDITVVP